MKGIIQSRCPLCQSDSIQYSFLDRQMVIENDTAIAQYASKFGPAMPGNIL